MQINFFNVPLIQDISNNDNKDSVPLENTLRAFSLFGRSEANGKLDEDFMQGNIGDCALLSSVFALSQTEQGNETIENSIKINRDDNGNISSYDIYFEGIDETYTVSQEELSEAVAIDLKNSDKRLYSRGDDDMTVLELAIEKCFTESDNPQLRFLVDNYTKLNEIDKLNGVNPAAVSLLFTGETVETVIKHDDTLKKRFVPCSSYDVNDINGNKINISEGGEYRANGIANGNLYISDLQNQSEMVVPVDSFLSDVYLPDINQADGKAKALLEEFSQSNDDSMLVFATMQETNIQDVNGEQITLIGPHAYSVTEVKNGIVTLVNPHDTSKEINIPQENLLSLSGYYLYGMDFEG